MHTPEPMRSPLSDYLRDPRPGASENYIVLPESLVSAMPRPWQNAMAQLLAEFHQAFAHLDRPEYRVIPSRWESLVNLDEEQLAEAGYLVEIDADGELVYRHRLGPALTTRKTRGCWSPYTTRFSLSTSTPTLTHPHEAFPSRRSGGRHRLVSNPATLRRAARS